MRRVRFGGWRWTAFFVLAAALAGGRPAHGDPITGIVSFGDSLSDVGNYYAATGGTVPPASYGYDPGRFTNGPNWVEYLAKDLGVAAPTASVNGGTDYAYGGAMTGTGDTSSTFLGATASVPNTGQQISTYLASHSPTASQLYTIWAGANDFLNGGQTNPLIPVQNIATEITTLAQAGARQFLIPNLPMLGDIPATSSMGAATVQGLNTLSTAFNAILAAEVPQLAKSLGVQIHIVDVNSLFNNALADPAMYGLTNVSASALVSGSNGQGYLFWDTVHPTTQVDQIIGGIAAQSVPEPSSWMIFGAVLTVTAGSALRRRRARTSAATS
jgi:phospholipase/lecithinase/hemolysin